MGLYLLLRFTLTLIRLGWLGLEERELSRLEEAGESSP